MSDTSVVVSKIPPCDVCKQGGVTAPAYADAALTLGSWGYVCVEHFNQYGKGLGLGRGQRLLLEDESERVLSEDDEDIEFDEIELDVEDEDDEEEVEPVPDTVYLSKEHKGACIYLADLIAERDKADAILPLTDREREMYRRRILKASVVMNVTAIQAGMVKK
jgi:hypothetical protein